MLHVVWAAKFRKYNPGLWTSIFLFLPLAIWILASVPAALSIHIIPAVLVILLNAGIMIAARQSSLGAAYKGSTTGLAETGLNLSDNTVPDRFTVSAEN